MQHTHQKPNTLARFIVLLSCLSMLLSIQCAFASEIKNASHRLHGASHKKGAVFPVASKAASKHSKQTGHSALNWTLDKRVPLPFKTILKNNNLLLEFVRLGSVFQ